MEYREVLKIQTELTESINATKIAEEKHDNINSIVRLMALSNPAKIPTLEGENKENFAFDVLQTQMNNMQKMLRTLIMRENKSEIGVYEDFEIGLIYRKFEQLQELKKRVTPKAYLKYIDDFLMNLSPEIDNSYAIEIIKNLYRERDELQKRFKK